MESVYKLSKYSQKIDEACRTNQLNKVMEYNKHELAYINKLSKYFGNQKGGATVGDVVGAVSRLVQAVVDDRDRAIDLLQQSVRDKSSVIEQIDDVIEGEKGIELGESVAPQPADVLKKVKVLKQEKDVQKARLQQVTDELQRVNSGFQQQNAQHAHDLKQAQDDLATAQRQAHDLQESLQKVAEQATAQAKEKAQANAELADVRAQAKDELTKVKAEAEKQKGIANSSIGAIRTIQTELAQVKEELAKTQKEVDDTKQVLQYTTLELQTLQAQGKP